MSATQKSASQPSDLARDVFNGAFAKQFGLKLEDLRIGLNVAKAMIQRGEPAEALKIYLALVLCEPSHVDFQIGLANCALLLDEPHLALQAASAAIALSSRDPRGYLLSGRCCIMMGQWAEAKEDLQDAIEFAKAAKDTALFEQATGFMKVVEANS